MGPDLRVRWDDVCANPADYEKLVKLLLQRLYPEGTAIDGVGGDGGREFQVHTAHGLIFYEAKSFIGRVSSNRPKRREQVEKSLASAAKRSPDRWHLVVPIDPNPNELAWLTRLRDGDFPFVDRWLGQTWLEEQLERHPDLMRRATENRLLESVRQYKIETEVVTRGLGDLVGRYDALDRLADELSPDYRPVVGRREDGTRTVELRAKHPDAIEDEPIGFQVHVRVPEEPDTAELREQLHSHYLFGTSVEIPGPYLSGFTPLMPRGLDLLGKSSDLASLALLAQPETHDLPNLMIAVHEPGATFPIASLGFQASGRTRGTGGGARLVAQDPGRTVELVVELHPDARHMTLHLKALDPHPILPSALLPSLRLLRALQPGNLVHLAARNEGATVREITEIPSDKAPPPGAELDEFIEDLALVQDRLHQTFALPREVTQADVRRVARLRRLVNGETVPWVRGSLNATLDPDRLPALARDSTEHSELLISWDDEEVRVGDEVLHTGPMLMTGTVTTDLTTLRDDKSPGKEPTATFELVDDTWFQARLGRPSDHGLDAGATEGPSGRGAVSYRLPPDGQREPDGSAPSEQGVS